MSYFATIVILKGSYWLAITAVFAARKPIVNPWKNKKNIVRNTINSGIEIETTEAPRFSKNCTADEKNKNKNKNTKLENKQTTDVITKFLVIH